MTAADGAAKAGTANSIRTASADPIIVFFMAFSQLLYCWFYDRKRRWFFCDRLHAPAGTSTGTPGSRLEAWITSELFTLATFFSAVTVSVMKLWKAERSLRHAFEDEIHFARQHVALAHLRPAAGAFLEMLEVGVLLAGQADKDEAGHLEAQRLAVQIGVIALDDSRPSPGRACGAGRAAR